MFSQLYNDGYKEASYFVSEFGVMTGYFRYQSHKKDGRRGEDFLKGYLAAVQEKEAVESAMRPS